jgi:phage/plasmid-like protein (TIGR03299 family)
MAHNIHKDKMVCVGTAWHDVGVRVEKEMTAVEVIQKAKLDYKVEKLPLYCKTAEGKEIKSDFLGTVNTESNIILGAVTDRYKVMQNVEAFNFFDSVVKSEEAFYHSAGALGNGERIWLLAKLPKNILVYKDIDIVEQYLLLTNSHDGTSALMMYFTPIRVVCQNTLTQSLNNKSEGISIRHTTNMQDKVNEARRALGLAVNFYGKFEEEAKKMVNTPLDIATAGRYYEGLLKIEDTEEASTQKKNTYDELIHLFQHGKGNDVEGIKNTVWAGYNAVTEYADFNKTFKGDNRVKSILFGSSAELKRRAFQEALVLTK